MLQNNNSFQTIQDLLNIKAGTLIAGLLGALITMLRRSDGSVQARLTGYVVAIISVLYVVPFVLWFLDWKYQIQLHSSAENLMSFIFGMISQSVTESFIDDPFGTCYKAFENFRRLKQMFWNNQINSITETPKTNEKGGENNG